MHDPCLAATTPTHAWLRQDNCRMVASASTHAGAEPSDARHVHTLATPMSPSFTFSPSSRNTFSVLISRCRIFRECIWLRPSRICEQQAMSA